MLNLSATDRDDSWFAIIQTKVRTCFLGVIYSLSLLLIGMWPIYITSWQSYSHDLHVSLKGFEISQGSKCSLLLQNGPLPCLDSHA